MKFILHLFIIPIIILLLSNHPYYKTQPQKDYLGVPGPIKYNDVNYKLIWSASPDKNYFKQEYAPLNVNNDSSVNLVLIEAVTGNLKITDAIKIKLTELQERSKIDPVLNYKLYNNPTHTEYVLDFIVSEGKVRLNKVEWNAYRYSSFIDSLGNRGILIFGIVHDETKNINTFLSSLANFRKIQLTVLEAYLIPTIAISDR